VAQWRSTVLCDHDVGGSLAAILNQIKSNMTLIMIDKPHHCYNLLTVNKKRYVSLLKFSLLSEMSLSKSWTLHRAQWRLYALNSIHIARRDEIVLSRGYTEGLLHFTIRFHVAIRQQIWFQTEGPTAVVLCKGLQMHFAALLRCRRSWENGSE